MSANPAFSICTFWSIILQKYNKTSPYICPWKVFLLWFFITVFCALSFNRLESVYFRQIVQQDQLLYHCHLRRKLSHSLMLDSVLIRIFLHSATFNIIKWYVYTLLDEIKFARFEWLLSLYWKYPIHNGRDICSFQ